MPTNLSSPRCCIIAAYLAVGVMRRRLRSFSMQMFVVSINGFPPAGHRFTGTAIAFDSVVVSSAIQRVDKLFQLPYVRFIFNKSITVGVASDRYNLVFFSFL